MAQADNSPPPETSRRDEGFKKDAVRLLLLSGQPVTTFAREIGIEQSSLHRWKKRWGDEVGDSVCGSAGTETELAGLRREMRGLRAEVEVLREIVRKKFDERYS